MKKILTVLVTISSLSSYAFINCKTNDLAADGSPLFSVNIYETTPIMALISDRRVSKSSKSYLCQKSTLTNDGDKLSTYDCVGGGFGEKLNIAVFINETNLLANYIEENENNDLENLLCEIF